MAKSLPEGHVYTDMYTQDGIPNTVSTGKDSIGKDRLLDAGKPHNHPTLEEVKAYCSERGNKVDPERFIDYYTSNGWKVGKNPMKDWKAAVRTWERSDVQKTRSRNTLLNYKETGTSHSNLNDISFSEDEL